MIADKELNSWERKGCYVMLKGAVRMEEMINNGANNEPVDDICCDICEIHPDLIRAAESSLPSDTALKDVAELYKLFSDYSRVRILYLLAERELCVCDLTELMEINQSAISNHLRLLRNGKLVKSRREGKNVYYALADSHVETILKNGLEHILEDKGDLG